MDAITSIIPVPRAVRIERAGVTVLVSEFTLRDLADLQGRLDSRWPDPLAEIHDRLEGAKGDERRKLLVAAYEAAEVGPDVYGEESGRAFYATPEGISLVVWVALRKCQPDMLPGDAAELASRMSDAEFELIWRIAHGVKAIKSLERMLGPDLPPRAQQKATWGQLIEEVIRAHPGWTYDDIYNLTLTEFRNARRCGQPETAGIPLPRGCDLKAMVDEQRRRFYGDPANPGAPIRTAGE